MRCEYDFGPLEVTLKLSRHKDGSQYPACFGYYEEFRTFPGTLMLFTTSFCFFQVKQGKFQLNPKAKEHHDGRTRVAPEPIAVQLWAYNNVFTSL